MTIILPKEYLAFCNNNKLNIKELDKSIIYEKHHILPKCVGGTNEDSNICYLLIEKHFEAHLLLAKLTNNIKLWSILYMMLKTRKNHKITINDKDLYLKIRQNYRLAVSKTSKERWKDKEYRDARIKTAQDAWKKPGYKENSKLKMDKYYNDPEYKLNLSEKIKKNWKNPEYRKKCLSGIQYNGIKPKEEIDLVNIKRKNSLKKTLASIEARELKSLRSKQNWQSEEYRNKVKNSLREYWRKKRLQKESEDNNE